MWSSGHAHEWAANRPLYAVLACLTAAAASLLARSPSRRGGPAVLFVFGVSGAVVVLLVSARWPMLAPVPQIAWAFAVLSLAWSLVAALTAEAAAPVAGPADGLHPCSVFRLSALLFGVAAGIIQAVNLAIRLIYVGIDLFNGYPWSAAPRFGLQPDGVWTFALLFASCAASLAVGRTGALATCQLWIAAAAALWSALLLSPFNVHVTGGFERSGMSVVIMLCLAGLVLGASFFHRILHRPADESLPCSSLRAGATRDGCPGFASSCAVLGAAVLLLACYHLLVPVRVGPSEYRGALWLTSLSAGATCVGSFMLLNRTWSDGLADAACGLVVPGVCGLILGATPMAGTALSERYPIVFNSLMVGLALVAGGCTYFAGSWQRPLRVGAPVPLTFRLIPHLKRCAFLSAALALVAAALMTYWPRVPGIAAMDHSLGRVAAGFAAHLFLLLVMLWCSRRLRRLTFHLLTLLALYTTAGFIVVRMAPFTSRLE